MRVLIAPALLVVIVWGGCSNPESPTASGSADKRHELSIEERAAIGLPVPDELTLANPEDVKYVATLSADMDKRVGQYLKPQDVEWKIGAACPSGDYLLLWITFPKMIDGGTDVIYSVRDKRIVGTFLGGYRG